MEVEIYLREKYHNIYIYILIDNKCYFGSR